MMMIASRLLAAACLVLTTPWLVADEPLTRSAKLPESTPWNLTTLSTPPDYQWLDDAGPVRSLLYAGEPYRGQPTQIFAYYASPGTLAGDAALDQDLPAVVLLHGGGGTAFREWAELWAQRGYAAIAMDLAGHRPIEGQNAHARENRVRLAQGGPNQSDEEKFGSIDEDPSEQWSYHAVAAAIRAHSLIRSFQGIDANRTAVTGISWGGYLTCIVAGVDHRFKAAVPVYGCGYLQDNSVWLDRFSAMTAEQRQRWNQLWDPSQYLPAISIPMLFVSGTNDLPYPLDSYMKSIAAVTAPKQLCLTVNMPHGHPPGWAPVEIGMFIDHYLRQQPALATIHQPKRVDEQIAFSWQSPRPITQAKLHYTRDSGKFHERQWTSILAKQDGQSASAPLPPADATAWFVTFTDDAGATVSSLVWLAQKQL